ncbi:MAG: B12-binding domain-containing radical SAM protein [Defluviitaleaceae bacterium]|nr:B12-binding domain-containing radical SAM protein [Defluviitaleaceae bacterium]
MDIVLVSSVDFHKHSTPALGLLTLRDILKPYFDVEIVDFDVLCLKEQFTYEDILEDNIQKFTHHIISKSPKIVGFYTICHSFDVAVRVAHMLKKNDSNIKIVFGGPHATHTYDSCLNAFDFIDAIALGESELIVLDLMRALMGISSIEDVFGIAYKKKGYVVKNKPVKRISGVELEKYAILDYSPYIGSHTEEHGIIQIEGGRGCPFSCTFCSTSLFWEHHFRLKTIDGVFKEFARLYNEYNINRFDITHDLFTFNREYFIDFCNKMIDCKLPYSWMCSSRIDILDKEMIQLLKKSKCKSIYFGIETASPRMQKLINKNLNLTDSLETITECLNAGVDVTVSFIYGFPDETIDDFMHTVDFIETLLKMQMKSLTIQLHCLEIYANTAEYEKVKDIMYYEKNGTHSSIHDRTIDAATSALIESHPDLFSHYYTFKNEVRDKYFFMETLIQLLVISTRYYKLCVKYMINKYGLVNLYSMMEHDISTIIKAKSVECHDDHAAIRVSLVKIFKDCCNLQIEKDYCEFFTSVFNYECAFHDYVSNRSKEPLVVKVNFDVAKAYRNNIHVKTEQSVQFYLKDGMYKQAILTPMNGLLGLSS